MQWMTRHGALLLSLSLGLTACMEGPENGAVITGNTANKVLNFNGKYPAANHPIKIQVLATPDNDAANDFNVEANWVTIANATTSSTPKYYFSDPDPYYEWSVSIAPALNSPLRWPQGGILRVRAIEEGGGLKLATFDHGWIYECDSTAQTWMEIGQDCKSTFPSAAVVSPSPTPGDAVVTPRYLSFTEEANGGNGSPAETGEYYTATAAAASLTAFKTEYGFGAPGSDEVTATYYNKGDLGVGREMRCKSFQKVGMASAGRACFVSNYSDIAGSANFGGNAATALSRAVQGAQSGVHAGAFATVAMAYYPPITDPNSVRFVVYDKLDQLAYEAQLDSKGYNKGIPQNCVVCHGAAGYDTGEEKVFGARFLPFDLDSFDYSTVAGFSRAAQEEKFRKLNRHIYNAGASQATKDLINGWYLPSTVNTVGAVANTDFVPGTFSETDGQKRVYKEVVAPYCRTCHISQSGAFSFVDGDSFLNFAGSIENRVCSNGGAADAAQFHVMPNAEVTAKAFWASPARAYLVEYLGIPGSCKPTF